MKSTATVPKATQNFFSISNSEFNTICKNLGTSEIQSNKIFRAVYQQGCLTPQEWPKLFDISEKVINKLAKHFNFSLPTVARAHQAKDKTSKLKLQLADQLETECVLIPMRAGEMTLCLSSQVGCAVACKFCFTGKMGLLRNLTCQEIIGQWVVAAQWLRSNLPHHKIVNLVYMGQGEPLHNFEEVKKATAIFLEQRGPHFGKRRITISTSGLVHQFDRLKEIPEIFYAISLHAVRNDLRSDIMPINKAHNLEKLMEGLAKIPRKAHQRITFEYILLAGINDSEQDIEGLCRLLPSKASKINLIPFNPYPGSEFKRPSDETIKWFQQALRMRGMHATIRATKGDDILAACGQLNT